MVVSIKRKRYKKIEVIGFKFGPEEACGQVVLVNLSGYWGKNPGAKGKKLEFVHISEFEKLLKENKLLRDAQGGKS